MVSIQDHHSSANPSRQRSWFKTRIGTKTLARLCHNVGTGLHAGVDIRRVWQNESLRGSARHRSEMSEIRDRISQGTTLTDAVRSTNGYFPPLFCEMVDVGERTGRIERVFLQLGDHYENILRLRRAFVMGIAWPMMELVLALGVIGLFILILGLIPSGPEGPPITFFGLYGSSGLMIYAGTLAAVFGCLAFVAFGVRNSWFNIDPLMKLLVLIPGIGRGIEIISMSRLTWSLSLATDSDIDASRAVELAVRTTQNSYYLQHLDSMKKVIRQGGEMHTAFQQTSAYPSDFLDALQTGEISGQISETMMLMAKEYEDRAKLFYRMLAVAAGVGIALLVGAIIIFMIFSLFMQYVDILNTASEI